MGRPAARITDLAGHGGTIMIGSPTVFIGGLMAARMGDAISCQAHGAGNILLGSTSVQIDGALAARMADPTSCGAAGVSGTGMPPQRGVPGAWEMGPDSLIGDDDLGLLWGQASGYSNPFGKHFQAKGSLAHQRGRMETVDGHIEEAIDAHSVEVEGTVGVVAGGFRARYAPSTVEVDAATGEARGKVLVDSSAEVGVDWLSGTDGRRIGYSGRAMAKIGAGGEVEVEEDVFVVPVLGITAEKKATVGTGIGEGGELATFCYYDISDGKIHIGFLGDGKLHVGGRFGYEIAIGPTAPNGVGVPAIPGVIATGCPTVFIGG